MLEDLSKLDQSSDSLGLSDNKYGEEVLSVLSRDGNKLYQDYQENKCMSLMKEADRDGCLSSIMQCLVSIDVLHYHMFTQLDDSVQNAKGTLIGVIFDIMKENCRKQLENSKSTKIYLNEHKDSVSSILNLPKNNIVEDYFAKMLTQLHSEFKPKEDDLYFFTLSFCTVVQRFKVCKNGH